MIHSKLKKGHSSQLLVQFHKDDDKLPRMLKNFYNVCKDQNIRVNKSQALKENILKFYLVDENQQLNTFQQKDKENIQISQFFKTNITSVQLKFILVYINEQNYPIPDFQLFKSQNQDKQIRVILLRETLEDSFFHLDYEVENTLSKQESLMYLCDLSAMLINCKYQTEIEVYDQKKDKMIRKGKQGELSELQVIWKNIIYQTPGLGRQKCKAIAEQYPTYQHLINDYQKDRQLKNLLIGKGTKQIKIGSVIAERLYKIFNSLNGKQTFY